MSLKSSLKGSVFQTFKIKYLAVLTSIVLFSGCATYLAEDHKESLKINVVEPDFKSSEEVEDHENDFKEEVVFSNESDLRIKRTINKKIRRFGNRKLSVKNYLSIFGPVAVKEMHKYNIPASITLAQGILETATGSSRLAKEANNHFGIKCHGWRGAKIYHDDDKKGECFRKYRSAYNSYRDHSLFLRGRSHYQDLFKLDIKDYEGWAEGLKKAGYATAPDYADRLISIIERYKLYRYDRFKRRGKFSWVGKTEQGIKESPAEENKPGTNDKGEESAKGMTVEQNKKPAIVISVNKPKAAKPITPSKSGVPAKTTTAENVKTSSSPKPTAKGNAHVVRTGDTLYSLAKKFKTTVEKIKVQNNIKSNAIFIGQKLIIPAK